MGEVRNRGRSSDGVAEAPGDAANTRVELRGVTLDLCGGGGVYSAADDGLFVADLHLGKGTTFRKRGLAVPCGSTHQTLQTVAEMLDRTGAGRLYFLGDLFHDPSSLSRRLHAAMEEFRHRHPRVTMTLVPGNHDRGIGPLPRSWRIETVACGHRVGALTLHHHPTEPQDDQGIALAGHLHPSFRLRTRDENVGRLPCFWYSGGCLVLPACGAFTGTHAVRPAAGDRIWVDSGRRPMEIPRRKRISATKGSRGLTTDDAVR